MSVILRVINEEEPSPVVTPTPSPFSHSSSPIFEQTDITGNQNGFTKLVRTIQFVKKWAHNSEELSQGRNEFLNKFNQRPSGAPDSSYNMADGWVAVSKKKCFIIPPTSRFLYWWMGVVTLVVLYNSFVIIARQTFSQLQEEVWSVAVWLILDCIADMVYVLDIVVQFRTGYLEQGLMVTDSRKIAIHYMKTLSFKLDILSSIPVEWLYAIPMIGVRTTIVRLSKLFKIYRMMQFFNRTESSTNWPNLLRLVTLMLYLSLIIHWNACFYFLISKSIGFGTDRWVYPGIEGMNATSGEYAEFFRQYIVSTYWSTLTLTTIGELPGPVSDGEHVFVILDFLVGVLIFATIIGMVGGIITNMNTRRTAFQSRLDTIKQYMRYRNVGKDLQKRVIKWFDYLWASNHSLDEQEILQLLPDKLHAEIAIHVNFESLSQVKIFEECEAGLLEELVLKLQPQVYSPGDYVCCKGDIGREMFIIKRGKLEVVGEDGQVIATLSEGGYFGEISILNLSGTGNRRTANVRSVGFSDLFCLSKFDLLEVLKDYPDARAVLEERGRRTLVRDGTLDGTEAVLNPVSVAGQVKDRRRTEEEEGRWRQYIHTLENRLTQFISESSNTEERLRQRIERLENRARLRGATT